MTFETRRRDAFDAFMDLVEREGDEKAAALMDASSELLEALEAARKCIAYCRQNHPDAQTGEGVPIEFMIDDVIARAKGES